VLITLLTDFGLKDPFAGVMKGAILTINPQATVVDITHGITPHDVKEAALTLADSYRYFPPKSIHVAVVDPGVGSGRRPLLVVTEDYYFVGPDNGVFTLVFGEATEVVHLTSEHYFLPKKGGTAPREGLRAPTTGTFHGRDIFAPVAAWLSKGIAVSNFGEPITDYVTLELSVPVRDSSTVKGEAVLIDGFGNAAVNITEDDVSALYSINPAGRLAVSVGGIHARLMSSYAEAEGSEGLSAVINSSGRLELFVYKGNAAKTFGIKPGDPVTLKVS